MKSDVRLAPRPVLLAAAWLLGLLTIGIALVGREATGLPFGYFSRDPSATTEEHPYLGFVSVVGLFGWWTAAVVLAVGAWHAYHQGRGNDARAFAVFAAAVAYLAMDDAFLFHDSVYPSLGISDHLTEPVYVLVTAVLLLRGRSFITGTDWGLLAIAGVLFGGSIASDIATDNPRYLIFEDGAKLLAILTLAFYALDTVARELGGSRQPGQSAASA